MQAEHETRAPDPGLVREFERLRAASFASLFSQTPRPPRMVGRFRLLRRLGQGGMGVVHAAHDPQLDREIAIKLLLPARLDAEGDERVQRRWLREARALAKVTHPNVVHAYEVGTFEGEAYLAMELVEGETLRNFRVSAGRQVAEILDVYLQAARGLAAAHAAGLVHRDFKPDNVVLATDGRARVLDFGLARAPGLDDEATQGDGAPREDLADAERITRTGTVLGTPAYMAPEQRIGDPVDARSDQYSFCVSLYEALHDTRPPSTTPDSISERDPISKVLRRGLATDARDRWPSMEALHEALEATQRPRGRRRRWLVLGAAAVTAALFTLGSGPQAEPACARARAALDTAWSEERAEQTRAHLQAAAPELAELAFDHLRLAFDEHTTQWLDLHAQTCDQPSLDVEHLATVQCLESRARLLDAVVSAIDDAPASRLAKLDRVLELPRIEDCAHPERRHQRMPLPEGKGELRRRVQSLRLAIAEADLVRRLGDPRAADLALTRLRRRVQDTDFSPLLVELELVHAEAALELGDHAGGRRAAEHAITLAKRTNLPLLEAKGWILLGMLAGYLERRADEGDRNLDLAEAAAAQAGGDAKLEVLIAAYRGHIDLGAGRFDDALVASGRALELERIRARERADVSSIEGQLLDTIGTILRHQGKLDEAEARLHEAHTLLLERVGPNHPKTGAALMALGNVALQRKDAASAVELYERSRAAFGSIPSELVPRLLNNLGQAYLELDRLDDSERTLQEAVSQLEARGNETIERARAQSNLSRVLRTQGRTEEALVMVESALTRAERALGTEHHELSFILLNRGLAHEAHGDRSAAARDAERIVAITSEVESRDNTAYAQAMRLLQRTSARETEASPQAPAERG